MKKRGIYSQSYKNILLSFATPKTPRQVEKELGLKKIKTKHLVNKGSLTSLNPCARKGRLYLMTEKLTGAKFTAINWDLIGWVISSPKQRHVILKTIAIDSVKRTSEDIRRRASRLNVSLTRISTKEILKELISKNLVKTELQENRKRYYWISKQGEKINTDIKFLNIKN